MLTMLSIIDDESVFSASRFFQVSWIDKKCLEMWCKSIRAQESDEYDIINHRYLSELYFKKPGVPYYWPVSRPQSGNLSTNSLDWNWRRLGVDLDAQHRLQLQNRRTNLFLARKKRSQPDIPISKFSDTRDSSQTTFGRIPSSRDAPKSDGISESREKSFKCLISSGDIQLSTPCHVCLHNYFNPKHKNPKRNFKFQFTFVQSWLSW
jgi:hypothetical protein